MKRKGIGVLVTIAVVLLVGAQPVSTDRARQCEIISSEATDAWLRGDDDTAEVLWNSALEIANGGAETHYLAISILESLGTLQQGRGNSEAAASLRRTALNLRYERRDEPATLIAPVGDLAWSVESTQDFDQALELWLEQLRLIEAVYPDDPRMLAEGYLQVGAFFERRGDRPRAKEYYNRALELRSLVGADSLPRLQD